jgi:hypothetical protein
MRIILDPTLTKLTFEGSFFGVWLGAYHGLASKSLILGKRGLKKNRIFSVENTPTERKFKKLREETTEIFVFSVFRCDCWLMRKSCQKPLKIEKRVLVNRVFIHFPCPNRIYFNMFGFSISRWNKNSNITGLFFTFFPRFLPPPP